MVPSLSACVFALYQAQEALFSYFLALFKREEQRKVTYLLREQLTFFATV